MGAALVALLGLATAGPVEGRPSAARRAVVVELFSSEGCSSCPPADAVLEALEAEQPVPGVEIVALELHVDYWNRLGWEDPFSRREYTQRQERYARTLDDRGTYTPQLIVDGRAGFLGSDRARALREVAAAAQREKAQVSLQVEGKAVGIQVRGAREGAVVLLALTESGLSTQVPRGENAGQLLRHAPVVRSLQQLGVIQQVNFTFQGPLSAPPAPTGGRGRLRWVVLVQDPGTLQVLGAATATL